MAWELTVRHSNGHRLGSPKEVMAALSRALPELQWHERETLPRTVGCLEDGGFSLEIYGLDDDPVEDFYLDVRGGGDPIPTLMRLKTQARWSIQELALGRSLDEAQMRERWAGLQR